MAWTSPRTWVVAETLTAALMNTHVKDQFNWLANDKPRCGAIRNSQSIPNNTTTTISFTDADEFDTGAMHDPGSNPSRGTVPSGGGGLYEVKGIVTWVTGVGATTRFMSFSKNGTPITGMFDNRDADANGNCGQALSFSAQLVATDFIELQVAQTTGGALSCTARLQLRWVAF